MITKTIGGGMMALLLAVSALAAVPKVGEQAPEFRLRTLDERTVALQRLTEAQPVVLVMLRGWPGYQCPLCTRQVQDFVAQAEEFKRRNATVVMVYPGPAEQLMTHARDFLADKSWPADFVFVLDPDYAFTQAYGLRWDAPKETAYPATFIIERGGRIRFAQVSRSHGDRVSASRALAALK